MREFKYIFASQKNELKIFVISITIVQLISIYIYNFRFDDYWFSLFRNLVTLFYIGVVILLPLYISKKILSAKINQNSPPLPGWALGCSTNIFLVFVFSVFGAIDFGVKFLLLRMHFTNSSIMTILAGTVVGTIVVLIFGIGAGWLAQMGVKSDR